MKNREFFTRCLIAGSVGLAAFLVYLPALRNGFVNWDDDLYVYENPALRQTALPFLKWAFFHFHVANWHPVTWLSHFVDYAIWGLNPFGHHLSNNILHAINASIVFFLAIALLEIFDCSKKQDDSSAGSSSEGAKLLTGAVTGLLFGIHPQHVESVAWVAERKDVLFAFFFLLSMLSYFIYLRSPHEQPRQRLAVRFYDRRFACSFVFFSLALLSKPMAVTLPVVLLIVDWYPSGRIRSMQTFKHAFSEKIPFFCLSLLSSAITILAQSSGKAIVPLENTTMTVRFMVGAKALIAYLRQVLAPVDLLPFYSFPKDVHYSSFSFLASVALVAGITAACLVSARTRKIWLAIWLYYVITLLPVLGIIRVGGQSMADRYTYIPTLGFFLIAGLGSTALISKDPDPAKPHKLVRTVSLGALGIIVLLLSAATIRQIGVWKNSNTLWSYLIQKEPRKIELAYYNRGLDYGRNNQLDLSIDDFTNAIAINPKFSMAYNNRGTAYFLKQKYGEAFVDFNNAIEIDNDNSEAYINRAYVYLIEGNKAQAASDLRKGCDLGNEIGCQALRDLI